jgi:hypothetical protein
VRLERRLYQVQEREYHFPLDEYLGLTAQQAATPELQALCTHLGGKLSFREAADFLEKWLDCSRAAPVRA